MYIFIYARIVRFGKSRMEVTRVSIVNLYSSSRYYYSFRFSSLLVHYTYGEERVRVRARAETRSTRVIRDGHDCGGETKKRKTKRERRKEEIERKKYCDETAKVVIANYEERIRLLIYAWRMAPWNWKRCLVIGKRNRRKVYRILGRAWKRRLVQN